MTKTGKIIVGVIVLIIIIAVGWKFYKKPVQEVSKEPIKIGAILPLSGSQAQFGEQMKQGMEMAADDANKNGGIDGRIIQVLFEDSQGDAKVGLAAYQKLRLQDKIQFVFSAVSGVTLAILPNATKDGVLVITSSTHPKITSGEYLAARIYFTPDAEAVAMADFAFNKLYAKRAAVIYLNDESLRGYNQFFTEEFKKLGGDVYSESYNFGEKDFRTQLTKIKGWKPDVFYIGGWKEVGTIIKQARELRLNVQIIGPITFDSPQVIEMAGSGADGSIFTSPAFDAKSPKKETEKLTKEYRARYDKDPEVTTAFFYDGLRLLLKAIGDKGVNSKNAFSEITETKSYEGALGTISFKENGDLVMPIGFKTIKDGKFIPLENYNTAR